jgi:hypothetical protein
MALIGVTRTNDNRLRSPPSSALIGQPCTTNPQNSPSAGSRTDHLAVTRRWIESQQQVGLPHLHTGGMNRYRISEVETWLQERYGSAARNP